MNLYIDFTQFPLLNKIKSDATRKFYPEGKMENVTSHLVRTSAIKIAQLKKLKEQGRSGKK